MDGSELPKLKRSNGNTISVNENPFIIGRALNCNYVIPNAQISRQHCSIEKVGDAWFLRDISTNGCYLNGTLVKKSSKCLSNNDIIGLCLDGSYDFSFQISQSRDTSISDEQLNMVADSLDTVLNEIEVSTVRNTEISSVPVREISAESVPDNSSLITPRIEPIPTISHVDATSNLTSTVAPFPICDNPTTNQEAISALINEIEVSTVPISEISSIQVQEMPVALDSSPSSKRPRLEPPPSISNTERFSNVLSSIAPLTACDNSGTNLQNTTAPSETSSLPHPSQPSSSAEKPAEAIIEIAPLPEQQYEEMEDEMMCSICSEMFFKAVTLNCSHTFCKYCIEKWKKNRNICPICRAKITTMNATLVLDNVIQKIVKTLPEDVQKRRDEVAEERERELRPPPAIQTYSRGRGRGASRGNRGARGSTRSNSHNYQPPTIPPHPSAPRLPLGLPQMIPPSAHIATIIRVLQGQPMVFRMPRNPRNYPR
ncbi:unnamed protein product [Callosobruchus maculatus]|uniref:E3 ubiquitin-protein ligase CHFR n=1 Tax=Callosobruchus maculatus TaxID=64391 RepID=A0A653DMG1_CALMS|nr:unnamed protein product [Callosobruchus maculatus]